MNMLFQLLEDSKFSKDIIKIKTISSTYMAASGLNPTRQMQVCILTRVLRRIVPKKRNMVAYKRLALRDKVITYIDLALSIGFD